MKDSELNAVLESLAPKADRGVYKMGTFLHITCMKRDKKGELVVDPCTECSGVSEEYERLTITKFGSTNEHSSATIGFRRSECEDVQNAQK
jgi:hypothetical protein